MDGNAQNEISQGNTMLTQMRQYNTDVERHNLTNETDFQQKIRDAQANVRSWGGTDQVEHMAELGSQALGQGKATAKTISKAYEGASTAKGFNEMGLAERGARTVGQAFSDAPVGEGAREAVEGVKAVASGASQALGSAGSVARDAVQTARTAVGSRSGLEQVLNRPATDAESGGLPKPQMPPSAKARAPTAGTEDAKPAVAEAEAGGVAEGIGKMAMGIGAVQGGYDAVKDMISGHIAGNNKESRAGNELGIVGGAFDALGFVIPGAGLIGAGLGVASAVESGIGDVKHQEKAIATTLPAEEKAGEEKAGAGPTLQAESLGQVASVQKDVVQQSSSGGTTAF
jgi:hypothetical protein